MKWNRNTYHSTNLGNFCIPNCGSKSSQEQSHISLCRTCPIVFQKPSSKLESYKEPIIFEQFCRKQIQETIVNNALNTATYLFQLVASLASWGGRTHTIRGVFLYSQVPGLCPAVCKVPQHVFVT